MKEKIIDKAEWLGWQCRIKKLRRNKWRNKTMYSVWFQRYTSKGQDLNVELEIEKLSDLPCKLYEYWRGFDPDEQAMLWVGPDGHGKNGAPYSLKDILEDMYEADRLLEELYHVFKILFLKQ